MLSGFELYPRWVPMTYCSWIKANEKRMAVKKERVHMIERSFDPS